MLKLKRLLSGMIALSMVSVGVLQSAGTVMALESAEVTYVKNILGKYLSDTEYASLDNVTISEAFDLYDLETMQVCNKDVFVTYYNNTMIGIMCVSLVNEDYYSTYQECSSVCIQDAFDNGTNIAFCCSNDEALIFDGDNFYDMYTGLVINCNVENEDYIPLNSIAYAYNQLEDYAIKKARTIGTTLEDMDYFNRVRNVDIDGGICWAASIAVKYNYVNKCLEGDGDYKTATKVYAEVRDSYESGLVKPIGNIQYVTRGLRIYGLSDTYCQTSASVTAIYYELTYDNPVLISMAGTKSDGSVERHSLIIGGVVYNDNYSAVYTVADSNTPTSILTKVHVKDADSSYRSFYYTGVNSSIIYDDWYRTYSFSERNPYLSAQ